jgi:hypothetical protein
MANRLVGVLIAVLSIWFLGSGCGGSSPAVQQDAAVNQDTGGGQHDTAPQTDAGGDGAVQQDGGQEDGGVQTAQGFVSETAGGNRITSSNYRLELFVAPVRPVGAGQSSNYKLQLGPGALRNAR